MKNPFKKIKSLGQYPVALAFGLALVLAGGMFLSELRTAEAIHGAAGNIDALREGPSSQPSNDTLRVRSKKKRSLKDKRAEKRKAAGAQASSAAATDENAEIRRLIEQALANPECLSSPACRATVERYKAKLKK